MAAIYHVAHDFRQAFRQRLSEWAFALIMLIYGLTLLLFPTSFDRVGYGVIRSLISEDLLGWALVAGGGLRCLVLSANGVWWQMYGARAWMAWSSMIVWALLALGFAESGTIGLPIAVFPVLAAFDFANAVRATQDAADRRVETTRPRLVSIAGSQTVGHKAAKRDSA